MADKLTDAEIADELKKYGEQVKIPIDRKKRPLLLKKLNHYRAKNRTPSQPKKATPSRKKQQPIEFSSEESETEENESSSPLGRIFGRAKRSNTSSFYSNTDTIEISPSTSKDEGKPRRNTRRSYVSPEHNSTSDYVSSKSNLYPDLSTLSSPTDNSKHRGVDRRPKDETPDFSYEQDFTDSDPDDSSYEVVNKSINTTFVYDNPDEEPTLHQTRTSPYRGALNKKSGLAQNSVLIQRQKNKSTMNHSNDLHNEEPEEPLEDAFQTEDNAIESSSYVSTVLVLLVAIFFLSISLTYVYLRRDYLFHTEKGTYTCRYDTDIILSHPCQACIPSENKSKFLKQLII